MASAGHDTSGVEDLLELPAPSCPARSLYVRDGKIQEFNCHIGMITMFPQLGVQADFASAVAAAAPEQ